MRVRTVVLPGEDRQGFNYLCDVLEAEWQRRTATELFYLEQMAVSQWKLTRMEVGESDVYHEVEGAKTQIPLLDRLWLAQSRMDAPMPAPSANSSESRPLAALTPGNRKATSIRTSPNRSSMI